MLNRIAKLEAMSRIIDESRGAKIVVGTAAGAYVGHPVAGGVVGGAVGQGINNYAAGQR